jgi:hypothetical protein
VKLENKTLNSILCRRSHLCLLSSPRSHLITGFPEAKLIKGNELRRGDYLLFSCSLGQADCSSRQKRVTESGAQYASQFTCSSSFDAPQSINFNNIAAVRSDMLVLHFYIMCVCAHANIVPLLTYSGNLVISDAHRLNGTRPAPRRDAAR